MEGILSLRRGLVQVVGSNTVRRHLKSNKFICKHCAFKINRLLRPYSTQIGRGSPWKILFFGTDIFSLPHLQALYNNKTGGEPPVVKSLEVVVPPIQMMSRLCPVEEFSKQHGLPVHHWPIPTMAGNFDVGVVVSFGKLIPARVINMFPLGVLNVHPSLLPRWRGPSPIIHTVLQGDKQTGVTIIDIRPKRFDVGPVLAVSRFPVPENCSSFQLSSYLADLGSDMLLQCLSQLPHIKEDAVPQVETGVTSAPKFNIQHARVNWKEQTVEEIHRQYRALGEIFSLRSIWKNKHVRLLDMVPPSEFRDKFYDTLNVEGIPGKSFYHKQGDVICIKCKNGWAAFRGIVIKKSMSAKAFYNGYLSKPENKDAYFVSLENNLDKLTAS